MNSNRSVVIVGAGVVGLATALYARRAGLDVTVVERGTRERESCSLGNAGMVVPSHFVPLATPGVVRQGLRSLGRRHDPIYVRLRASPAFCRWGWHFMRSATRERVEKSAPLLRDLLLLSRRCFEQLTTELGNSFALQTDGLLMLCRTERGLAEEAHTAHFAERLGIDARVLNAREVAALEPDVQLNVLGGVYYSQDCHLSPQRFVAALQHELRQIGVKFAWEAAASGWRVERGHVVALVTNSGDYSADEFVLAAGAWSPQLTRGLDLRLPVEAGKGYSFTLQRPPIRPRRGAILVEARVAVTPMDKSLRFAGTMEISGLDTVMNLERARAITDVVPTYYPQISAQDFANLSPWQGFRPCSPDGLPYIGRIPNLRNFSVATGHGMLGLSLAPATGWILAGILTGETPSIQLAPFAPNRFG